MLLSRERKLASLALATLLLMPPSCRLPRSAARRLMGPEPARRSHASRPSPQAPLVRRLGDRGARAAGPSSPPRSPPRGPRHLRAGAEHADFYRALDAAALDPLPELPLRPALQAILAQCAVAHGEAFATQMAALDPRSSSRCSARSGAKIVETCVSSRIQGSSTWVELPCAFRMQLHLPVSATTYAPATLFCLERQCRGRQRDLGRHTSES